MKSTKRSKSSTKPLRGEKLCKAVVNEILLHPETWNQEAWHSDCNTKHCFAGWCQIKAGNPINDATAMQDAREALGISQWEANYLFRSNCTLSEMYYFAENFNRAGFNRAGFDRAGFDRAGFNRDGFNRDGFNRDGFNRAGFDRDGFDRAGFNRAGFNRAGFDRDGFDRAGFDRDGFNRDGFNRAGFNRAGFDRAGFDRAGFNRAGKQLKPFVI